MHVVKKVIAPESKNETWEVGWVEQWSNDSFCWHTIYETVDRESAFYVCSWLNGGPQAVFYLRRGK
jgi:hypothetical protein